MDPATFALVAGLFAIAGALIGIALGRHVWPAIRGDGAAALQAAQMTARGSASGLPGWSWQLHEQIAAREAAEAEEKAAADRSGAAGSARGRSGGAARRRAAASHQRIREHRHPGADGAFVGAVGPLAEGTRIAARTAAPALAGFPDQGRDNLPVGNPRGAVAERADQAPGRDQPRGRQPGRRSRPGACAASRSCAAGGARSRWNASSKLPAWSRAANTSAQGRGLGLRNEEGGLQRPDIIVLLPEQRTMIIDSKLPLLGYERLTACTDETEQQAAGVQFVRDVKGHIDGLSGQALPGEREADGA